MKDLFYSGGPLFMSILSIILIIMLAWTIYQSLPIILGKAGDSDQVREKIKHIKTIGLFGFIFGILGQLIGMYQAFSVIEEVGDISPSLLAGGLKVSMITTLYGFCIYMLSLVLWFIIDNMITRKMS